jgi:hypothetical protein
VAARRTVLGKANQFGQDTLAEAVERDRFELAESLPIRFDDLTIHRRNSEG